MPGSERIFPVTDSVVGRYGLAVVGVGLAILLTRSFDALREVPTILFFAGVFGSAWFGGLGPGLGATVLSVVALDWFFLGPAAGSGRAVHMASLLFFGLVAVLSSYLMESRGRAERAALAACEVERQAREVAEEELRKRQQLESQLNARAAELLQADRSKDDFLATLAHELRNPLAPISNALHLLKLSGNNGSDFHWARDVIDRQVRQIVRLVDDLLDVSRIARGKLQIRKAPVQLGSVIGSAVEISRPLIEQRRHQLVVTPPAEPIWLEADEARLVQVVANLLNNAAKYTEDGGRIWLTAAREGGEVTIRVRDTGVGIPPEMLPRVFERFVQVERSLSRAHGGLGIGLTLVRTLVEFHGGKVQAFSNGPGKGSEFVVRLPVSPTPPPGPEEGTGPRPIAQTRRLRTLLVAQDRKVTEDLGRLLQTGGHRVRAVAGEDQAMAVIAELHPELVFCEFGAAGIDGRELARSVRQLSGFERVALAALVKSGRDEDLRRAAEAGFDYQLLWPVDPRALQAVLAMRGPPLHLPATPPLP